MTWRRRGRVCRATHLAAAVTRHRWWSGKAQLKPATPPTVPALALERRRRLRPRPPSAAASPTAGTAAVNRQRRRLTCTSRHLLYFGSYQGSSLSQFLVIMNVILIRVSDLV